MATHQGECFCGAVKIEVTGEPQAMGYCHCRSCRSWSGGPVNAFSLWKPEDVKVTAGTEHVATFAKTPMSERQYCKKCGGHLMANHPPLKMVDVFAATIPSLKFVPGVHVNYGETVLPMKDGLTKFNDFPVRVRRIRKNAIGVRLRLSAVASFLLILEAIAAFSLGSLPSLTNTQAFRRRPRMSAATAGDRPASEKPSQLQML